MVQIIDGKKVSDQLLVDLKEKIEGLISSGKRRPGLAVILVGNDPASATYVGRKKKVCESLGMKSFDYVLSAAVTEDELIALIERLNNDQDVDGILLQVPLPKGLNERKLLDLISHEKDVDGFHPVNVGKLLLGLPTFKSCTPFGVCELLKAYKVETSGKHVVIVGRSNIVGKPLSAMLIQKSEPGEPGNATVTVCHSRTKNLKEITLQADILIAAIGQPLFVKEDMVKEGAVVIDVGVNRVDDSTRERGYKLVGDVDFEGASKKARLITPVPGGVGPMTIAMLMKNTLKSYLDRV
ncbi:bifunctional methylenetetrahydrofolate dehydrogenase/methenyltetrahydrofolate cyclohydrolase FolD [bacterium]|nr:bifunctional methylenetetrahydrofolate dehydrogenase/methenyltetrahydrofolate cyclohydrolase FolD [bacterium]